MNLGADLKIAKEVIRVELADISGQERTLEVFVKLDLTVAGGSERLQDVFAARRFIPVRDGAQLELLSTAHVVYFRLDLMSVIDELDPQVEHDQSSQSVQVQIELEGGRSLQGSVRYVMPQGHDRLVDYLATEPRWLLIRTVNWFYFVNRDRVIRVIPRMAEVHG